MNAIGQQLAADQSGPMISGNTLPVTNVFQNGISMQRNLFPVSEQSQRMIDETRGQILNGGEMWGSEVNSVTNGINSWSSMNGISDNSNIQAVPNALNSLTSTNGNGMNSQRNVFNSGFNSWSGMRDDGMAVMEMGMERMIEQMMEEEEERRRREEEMMRMEEDRRMEEERNKREEENKLQDDSLAWLLILSGFRLFLFSEASGYFIDEYLEYNLEELGVPDAPRLAILLAASESIARYTFINSGNIKRTRQELCTPALDKGNGSQPVKRFYYDSASDECRQFTYSGSGGSGNRFERKRECDTLCRPTSVEAEDNIKYIARASQISEVIDFIIAGTTSANYPTRVIVQLALVQFFGELPEIVNPDTNPIIVDASEING